MDTENIKDRKIEQITRANPGVTYVIDKCLCNVLIIDEDDHFRNVILDSLKYFSFNGKELNIIETDSINDAERIVKSTDDIILIIFNKMTFGVNPTGNFMNILERYINERNGKVIFRYNGASPKPFIDMTSSALKMERNSEFEQARDRLVDLAQMAIVTYNNNMEAKPVNRNASSHNKVKSPEVNIKLKSVGLQKEMQSDESASLEGNRLYEMLAHGLKGPIGNIKVLMDALTSDPDLFDKKTSHQLLSNVRSSADSMNEMIDSFLFWSRIRKNELDFNPIRINVKNLIFENINLLKGTANQKDVELRFDILDDAIAFADEVMITTVLRNLIYNGIKFTSRGGQVFTKVDLDADFVKISVEDTGVGISENDIEKLFDKDAKIASKGTENETGSGLGLLLCKDYVEKNGGEISIESEEGKGSVFRFSIPRWKSISKN